MSQNKARNIYSNTKTSSIQENHSSCPLKITRHAKKQENTTHNEDKKKNHSIETKLMGVRINRQVH